mmetsp:Transcript_7971/g.20592  ORF Transcript_7971/g.20592 Transcript_7971/m.20592 type:complete len:212 (-) Transcript_7971:807-1442(-)
MCSSMCATTRAHSSRMCGSTSEIGRSNRISSPSCTCAAGTYTMSSRRYSSSSVIWVTTAANTEPRPSTIVLCTSATASSTPRRSCSRLQSASVRSPPSCSPPKSDGIATSWVSLRMVLSMLRSSASMAQQPGCGRDHPPVRCSASSTMRMKNRPRSPLPTVCRASRVACCSSLCRQGKHGTPKRPTACGSTSPFPTVMLRHTSATATPFPQ